MSNNNVRRATDRDGKLATHQSKREIIREGKQVAQERKKEEAKGYDLAPFEDDEKAKENTDTQ